MTDNACTHVIHCPITGEKISPIPWHIGEDGQVLCMPDAENDAYVETTCAACGKPLSAEPCTAMNNGTAPMMGHVVHFGPRVIPPGKDRAS